MSIFVLNRRLLLPPVNAATTVAAAVVVLVLVLLLLLVGTVVPCTHHYRLFKHSDICVYIYIYASLPFWLSEGNKHLCRIVIGWYISDLIPNF